MAMFQERFVNQVQQATDIVDLIGQFVALRKSGKEFLGLCPFHQDHRPSMTVSPAKQIFKCFACGAGGNAFSFLMLLQKMSFPEAVKELAQRAGIPLPRVETPVGHDSSLSAETLLKVTSFAAGFYREKLSCPEGSAALAYARGRKLSDESIARFGLGYAPDAWDGLRRAAVDHGFSDRQLVAAGMLIQREDGACYDRFRDRLMFPIHDVSGRAIAFGGRALSAEEQAKYLNSSETALFDKSANLYGVNWAREHISKSGQAVVVEGYLDVLLPQQAGIGNVVATLGTSLTERHVRLLSRYAKEVVLVFDSDVAGQAAAERAIELFLSQRLNVRVATVPTSAPDGSPVKDPCDYVVSAGAEALRQVVTGAPDALQFAWSRRQAAYRQAASLAEKRAILEEFLGLLASSAACGAIDALRQGLLAAQVAEMVGVSPGDVAEQFRRLARRAGRTGPPGAPTAGASPPEAAPAAREERWLLEAIINEPGLLDSVREKVQPTMFGDGLLRRVAEHVWRLGAQDELDLTRLLRAEESPEFAQVVTDLQLAGEKRGNHAQTALDATEVFLAHRRRRDLAELRASQDADSTRLLRQAQERSPTDRRRRPRLP